jgi:TPR repeat protein
MKLYSPGRSVLKTYAVPIIAVVIALGIGFREYSFYILGVSYHRGLFLSQDYKAAGHWFEESAALGYTPANNNIAVMYMLAHGYPQNFTRAAKQFRIAADDGIAEAQFNLAMLHYKGRGVSQSGAHAYLWLRLAADSGVSGAKDQLVQLQQALSPEERARGRALYAKHVAAR